jgi:malto-oligosyltrehalose synthase/4-alpha-glucanotransferase
MFNPVATYRIQFHRDFTFKSLENILPYLQQLGVRTLYAAPIFEAVPGSNHGYDVVDPHRINPEIGTAKELRSLSKKLKKLNISWIQDIVPNHMAFHPNNHWLMDVLEKGRDSDFADYFDISWDAPAFGGKIMVPFLGGPLEKLIQDGQLTISYQKGGFKISYGEQVYPLNMTSSIQLLKGDQQPVAITRLLAKANNQNFGVDAFKEQLADLYGQAEVNQYVKAVLHAVNAEPGELARIAVEQNYQFSYWRDSDSQINYRRFFTVNGLICLNMQDRHVFEHYHVFIKTLLTENIIQGLRVDHIDGLFDPKTYLQRLREMAGPDTYIVVEKILEEGEQFPADWPVQGSTGYDFLSVVNNLFTSAENQDLFATFYRRLVPGRESVAGAIFKKKAAILFEHMGGELENLYRLFAGLATSLRLNLSPELLKATLAEFLIRFPVYRYYGNVFPLAAAEQAAIGRILAAMESAHPAYRPAIKALTRIWLRTVQNDQIREAALYFYQRCMQFTGPLMAKGVEDTLMYTRNHFVGHNEVGDSPAAFGLTVNGFHQFMQQRQQTFPLSLNATATHDTKRGEDVRAKLNVLTALGPQWLDLVAKWEKQNAGLKTGGMPDNNDEYLIYQTLTGFYPLPGANDSDVSGRLQAYLIKALREAKVHTQWAEPDEAYEQATLKFAAGLLQPGSFCKSFQQFQTLIADRAIITALAQVLVKLTCPGIPDIYQGCELWDFSLVDPDNRRPVDYRIREALLKEDLPLTEWRKRPYDGGVKLHLTRILLQLRQNNAALFTAGSYVPLAVKGKYRHQVAAYARCHLKDWLIVAIPLQVPGSEKNGTTIDWKDTLVELPEYAPVQWVNQLTEEHLTTGGTISVNTLFRELPWALLKSATQATRRGAGLIMHITSLPSFFGIGDLGAEARAFADFLSRSGLRYWQLLPLNPTGPAAFNSPYSAYSSMAGNTLLISAETLAAEGLLTAEELDSRRVRVAGKVNFDQARSHKEALFSAAFRRYKAQLPNEQSRGFFSFCKKEAAWLDDYALYEALKTAQQGKPWYEWPETYKCRDAKALRAFQKAREQDLEQIKWLQFQFFKQWTALKAYGNELGIQFFGDLPFYVNYDSADVWTHPEIFKLDDQKAISGIAGVPPDYFNADGQLWGMPVYNWQQLAATNYSWWVNRIRKNREFFDLIRLDHFRAFYDFWEVPAGEKTAVNGTWQAGPGAALFRAIAKELGELPFVAEDLGEVSPGVYALRDELRLPGMNVLQYAFGADMPVSIHIPHNHLNHSVTYTGTHDNNTTIGWFNENASRIERQNVNVYTGSRVNKRNVHTVLTELCFASVSEIAIVPVQDILGLDENDRMNLPASKDGNWSWLLKPGQLTAEHARRLRSLVKKFNR